MAINNITYGDVEEFFSELISPTTPKARKYYVYGTYQRAIENAKVEKEFEDVFKSSDGGQWNYSATMIGEDMCVVTWYNKGEVKGYIPCYKDKEGHIHDSSTAFLDFDEAVLGCVAFKKTNEVNAVEWMCKLIANNDSKHKN